MSNRNICSVGICLIFNLVSLMTSAISYAQAADLSESKRAKLAEPTINVNVTLGATYHQFSQSFATGAVKRFDFESVSYPFIDINADIDMSEKTKVSIQFLRYLPSATSSNGTIVVESKTLALGSIGFQVAREISFRDVPNPQSQWRIVGGLSFSAFPLLTRTSATTVDAGVFNTTIAAAGIENARRFGADRWVLENRMIISYPLMSGGYEMSSPLLFEYDFEILKKYSETFSWGVYWSLQLQQYAVSGSKIDPVSNRPFHAEQENLFSSLGVIGRYRW